MSTTADTSRADARPTIRPARVGDRDRILVLLKQLDASYAPDRQAFDESFDFLLDDQATSVMLVAEDATGLVTGYALTTITPLLNINGKSAQLQELVVENHSRGHGVGTALIEEIEAVCRARSVKQLTVASRRSADFYERLGYRSTADFLKRTFDD